MTDRIDAQPLNEALAERLDGLFRRYSGRLLGYARTQTRDAEAAQDVAVETWLRAGKRLHLLEAPDEGAFPWLRTIAQYAAVEYYRGYERPEDWTDAVSSRTLPAAASAEDVALTDSRIDSLSDSNPELTAALDALPELDREVIRLRIEEGLSWDGIGQSYGRTCGAAHQRYHRVIRDLRATLALTG